MSCTSEALKDAYLEGEANGKRIAQAAIDEARRGWACAAAIAMEGNNYVSDTTVLYHARELFGEVEAARLFPTKKDEPT